MVVNQMKMRHPLLQMSKESLQLPAEKGVGKSTLAVNLAVLARELSNLAQILG